MSDMHPLDDFSPAGTSRRGFSGVTAGIVTNNKDPEKLGRVKVKLPWLSDKEETSWARVMTPMGGKERGLYFMPEVDDEVLVAFAHGDVSTPYVLGALWSKQDRPPLTNEDGKNDVRTIKSRSGHVITLDDTSGAEKIIVRDRTQKNEIVIDSKTSALTVKSDGSLTIESKGAITIKSTGGAVEIDCTTLKITTQQGCEITSQGGITMKATAQLALTASAGVNMNNGALEII